jgi:hypothetical protein
MIGFRVEPYIKDAARRAAARDRRSLSSLLAKLLVEFLSAEGLASALLALSFPGLPCRIASIARSLTLSVLGGFSRDPFGELNIAGFLIGA